jgi:hypothetical protein
MTQPHVHVCIRAWMMRMMEKVHVYGRMHMHARAHGYMVVHACMHMHDGCMCACMYRCMFQSLFPAKTVSQALADMGLERIATGKSNPNP